MNASAEYILITLGVISVSFLVFHAVARLLYTSRVESETSVALVETDSSSPAAAHRIDLYATRSGAIFRPGCGLRVAEIPFADGIVNIDLSTRYREEWGSIQDSILVEVELLSGIESPNLIAGARDAVANLLAAVSVTANAWVGSTSDIPEDSGMPVYQVRELDELATAAFLERLSGHPHEGKLWEAVHCYQMALGEGGAERERYALARFHAGMMILAEIFNGSSRGGLSPRIVETQLYRGDSACYRAAQAAWDKDDRAIHDELESCGRDDLASAAARYFRDALFQIVELDEPHCSRLLAEPYDSPILVNLGVNRELRPRNPRLDQSTVQKTDRGRPIA